MELTRRVHGRPQIEGVGTCNQWILRSVDGTSCTFPPDERISVLGAQLGENLFLGIGSRGINNLVLNIRLGVPRGALDAFTEALGNETVATETTETR